MKQFTNTLKQKSFERHKYPCLNASNFDYFGTLSPNHGEFWVSPNHPHTSFKKTISPKNVSWRHCLKEKLCCLAFHSRSQKHERIVKYAENSWKNVHRESAFQKRCNYMISAHNFTLNKVFAIIALSYFIFCFKHCL